MTSWYFMHFQHFGALSEYATVLGGKWVVCYPRNRYETSLYEMRLKSESLTWATSQLLSESSGRWHQVQNAVQRSIIFWFVCRWRPLFMKLQNLWYFWFSCNMSVKVKEHTTWLLDFRFWQLCIACTQTSQQRQVLLVCSLGIPGLKQFNIAANITSLIIIW